MTNPNNAIGTNAAFGGRTSVNAFNDSLGAWTRGVMSGWACVPSSGMAVALGGNSDIRDVAVAEDDAGNKTSINNISLAPVIVTIPGAPASNTRIDSIVAYVDNPPQGTATITDNYESCGIIVVSGTASSSPVPPSEAIIRSAITSDGATGTTAYYVILANISVATGTTDITSGEIQAGDIAKLSGTGVVSAPNIDFATFGDGNYSTSEHDTGFTWVDGRKIYKKTINIGTLPNNETISVPHGISNLARIIKIEGNALRPGDGGMFPLPYVSGTEGLSIYVSAGYTELFIGTGSDRTNMNGYITVYYVKSS